MSLDVVKTDYITSVCDSPGEINELLQYDIDDFANLVEKAIIHLPTTGITNAFKLGESIALKADSKGYDLKIFWKIFKVRSAMLIAEADDDEAMEDFYRGIKITQRYLNLLKTKGVNKAMLFGAWLMDIRFGEG